MTGLFGWKYPLNLLNKHAPHNLLCGAFSFPKYLMQNKIVAQNLRGLLKYNKKTRGWLAAYLSVKLKIPVATSKSRVLEHASYGTDNEKYLTAYVWIFNLKSCYDLKRTHKTFDWKERYPVVDIGEQFSQYLGKMLKVRQLSALQLRQKIDEIFDVKVKKKPLDGHLNCGAIPYFKSVYYYAVALNCTIDQLVLGESDEVFKRDKIVKSINIHTKFRRNFLKFCSYCN